MFRFIETIKFKDFSQYEDSILKHKKWIDNSFQKRIEIINNKLYNFEIHKVSEQEHGVFLKIHHIAGNLVH